MEKLNLEVKTNNEKIIFDYLSSNVSESLRERINKGTKTLAQCWNYIMSEARKHAQNGCACIEDNTVYGWAVHFFEEESIDGGRFSKSVPGSAVAKQEKSTEVTKAKAKKQIQQTESEQLTFDLFGGL